VDVAESQASPARRRRERERQALSERILDVARDMFVRDGYEAVTLNRIAEAVEYTPGAIYQYFRDKRALVMAIIAADYVALRDEIARESSGVSDPVERLRRMGVVYAAWGAAHPNHYRLLTVPPPAWAESGRELREHENPPLEEDAMYLMGQCVAEACAAGRVREPFADSPGLVAMTLWAGIHGVVLQEIALPDAARELLGATGITFDTRLQAMMEVMVRGFLRDGECG
jgi:AcrR family transcriptional regulator